MKHLDNALGLLVACLGMLAMLLSVWIFFPRGYSNCFNTNMRFNLPIVCASTDSRLSGTWSTFVTKAGLRSRFSVSRAPTIKEWDFTAWVVAKGRAGHISVSTPWRTASVVWEGRVIRWI